MHFGFVNIDDDDGHALAKRLGVLKEGVPNLQVVSSSRLNSVHAMNAEVPKSADVISELRQLLHGFHTAPSGYYLKAVIGDVPPMSSSSQNGARMQSPIFHLSSSGQIAAAEYERINARAQSLSLAWQVLFVTA